MDGTGSVPDQLWNDLENPVPSQGFTIPLGVDIPSAPAGHLCTEEKPGLKLPTGSTGLRPLCEAGSHCSWMSAKKGGTALSRRPRGQTAEAGSRQASLHPAPTLNETLSAVPGGPGVACGPFCLVEQPLRGPLGTELGQVQGCVDQGSDCSVFQQCPAICPPGPPGPPGMPGFKVSSGHRVTEPLPCPIGGGSLVQLRSLGDLGGHRGPESLPVLPEEKEGRLPAQPGGLALSAPPVPQW